MPVPPAPLASLFAQQAAPSGDGGLTSFLIMMAPVAILFYFLILRPQQHQQRRQQEMLAALKKNDRVLTTAGIYGTVVSIDNEAHRVVLRVDDDRGVKVVFNKASVAQVLEAAEKSKAAEDA